MNYSNLFKIALRSIMGNKLRGFLTMLGIIIGVAAVIAMLAIGQGSQKSIASEIGSMGSNMIYIRPGSGQMGGVRMSAGEMQTLKLEDYQILRDQSTLLSGVSPEISSSGQAVYGANNQPTTLKGGSVDYQTIRGYTVQKGEWFTEYDVKTAAKVCLVGKTVVETLFPNGEDPLGKTIRFRNIPLKIIGVLTEKGYNNMGMDQDDEIIAPYTTVQKRVLAITYLTSVIASAVNEEYSEQAIAEIEDLIRFRHGLRIGEENDFNVRSMQEILEVMNSTMQVMTLLLACIAGISLLVGGIGIMNIMYVSVKERTREIGLRMAIGAKGSAIMAQFLIEAVLLSVVGGIIGILIGAGASYAIKALFHWEIVIQPAIVALSFLFCTFIGVFFGWVPARSGAKLDPIEALRYE
ncbi:ABC transporter permease [Bacteroidales bacterium OttesenSCG-928-C19]|nr:ABC transporter permease [Bacteroidales bacterium OttesenSCG-928-C19]